MTRLKLPARTVVCSTASTLLACAALSGCATPGGLPGGLSLGTPRAEPPHGAATRHALAQQVLRPQAPTEPAAAPAFDGVAAVHALSRQREGFKSPPASFGVLGIGSGSGTGQP